MRAESAPAESTTTTSEPTGADAVSDGLGAARGPRLADYTTLRLGGPAADFVEATDSTQLVELVREADTRGQRVLLLGGGSNLVVADAGVDAQVIRIATRGCRFDNAGDGLVHVTVEAGEDWDAVVAETVRQGLGGLECLSGIPGLTGATPVQNVGAYGVEIAQVLVSVDVLDRRTGVVRTIPAGELGLSYRTSVLKHRDDAVVLRVRFLLRAGGQSALIRYAELARALDVEPGQQAEASRVRAAVLGLRRGKGMLLNSEDHDTWSAGSFFTNPIVRADHVESTVARVREVVGPDERIPQFPVSPEAGPEEGIKLSAAWLIDRAGYAKGYVGPGGRVALSTKHTLALTNRGSASTEDLLELARDVRNGVRELFGVSLQPEPILVDCAL